MQINVTYDIIPKEFKEKIDTLEKEMLKLPQAEWTVNNHFGPGVYVREMVVPAGTIIVGHEHKHSHLNIMLKGRMKLLNQDGTYSDLVAPFMFVAGPGRKAAYCVEEVVWLNIHPNIENETDVEKLEDYWIVKSEAWKETYENRLLEKE